MSLGMQVLCLLGSDGADQQLDGLVGLLAAGIHGCSAGRFVSKANVAEAPDASEGNQPWPALPQGDISGRGSKESAVWEGGPGCSAPSLPAPLPIRSSCQLKRLRTCA